MNKECRLLRIDEVLKIIPVSKSNWWDGVKKGRYPESVRLGSRITCWRLKDIELLVENGIDKGNDT